MCALTISSCVKQVVVAIIIVIMIMIISKITIIKIKIIVIISTAKPLCLLFVLGILLSEAKYV